MTAYAVPEEAISFTGLGIWRYRTETVAPPASGQIRFDNADVSLATEFYLHETNSTGNDVSVFMGLLMTEGSVIFIQDRTDATKFILLELGTFVDNGVYRTFQIAAVIEGAGGEPVQNTQVAIIVNGGAAGGGNVFKVGTPVNEQFAIWTGDGTLASTPDISSDGVTMLLTPLIVRVTQNFRSRGLDDRATARRLLVFNNVSQWGPGDNDEYSFSRVLDTGSMGAAGGSGKTGGGNFIFRGDAHSILPGDFSLRSGVGVFLNWDESAGITTFSTGIGNPKTLALTIDASQDFTFAGDIITSGLIDGIDIGVDVPLNTAKVTNATHTGQVTGATALALDVTAITAQPASGVLVGTDTLIVNDGGVLSEVTMDQIATFTGAGGAPVDSVFGRTGAVTALQADYDAFFLTPAEGDAAYGTIAAVALNTAKVTNATHTGQVTGATALALDITAITAQPAAGSLVGADTFIVNDGGVLSEISATAMATFFGSGVSDHTLLTNIGVNTHAQIDTHIADGTLHFTEGSIDHTAILNIGTNSHAAIDAHIAIAVTKVGTPVDNQIGVWTGDGTLEGDADFLWDGSGGANTALRVTAPVGLTSGYLVDIYADQAGKTQAAVRIQQNDNVATADALLIQQNSNSSSAVIFEATHTATSSAAYAARIRTSGVHSGAVLRLHHDNPSSTGHGLVIKVDGSGDAINVELGDIVTVGNVEAAQFIGDGSLLTGLPGGGDVTKVGTPVNNQIGVWTGDGTLEGEADLTYDGTTFSIAADLGITGDLIISATVPTVLWSETNGTVNNKNWVMAADVDQFYIQLFNDAMSAAAKVFTIDRTLNVADLFSFIGDVNVTGDITLTGTVDGIDIATDVAANTAKVSNATHTGQVTGATALALDVTAVTAQPASGALVGTDTIIVNDGGTLSEATMDQVATFAGGGGGDTKRYVQVSGSGAAQVITGTPITMDLSVSDITTGAGDFTLAADAITVINAGTYRISAQCTVADTDTAGSPRTTIELAVEVNSSPVAGSVTRDYHRETEDNTGTVNFFVTLSANDVIRCRLDRLGAATNIQTVPTLCKLNIELIS